MKLSEYTQKAKVPNTLEMVEKIILAEINIINKWHQFWVEIDELSWHSKSLYNAAN